LWERLVAAELARSTCGVRDVKNLLAVNPLVEIKHEGPGACQRERK